MSEPPRARDLTNGDHSSPRRVDSQIEITLVILEGRNEVIRHQRQSL